MLARDKAERKFCDACGEEIEKPQNFDSRKWKRRRFCSRDCFEGLGPTPVEPRFWSRVQKTDTCWLWTGHIEVGGYGSMHCGGARGRSYRAHRLSWELHFGAIPEGMMVCHTCDVRRCVNPEHFFLGDAAANLHDAMSKARHPHGVSHGNARLTDEAVREIRRRRAASEPLKKIAGDFRVDISVVSAIARRIAWAHVVDIREPDSSVEKWRDVRAELDTMPDATAEVGE